MLTQIAEWAGVVLAAGVVAESPQIW